MDKMEEFIWVYMDLKYISVDFFAKICYYTSEINGLAVKLIISRKEELQYGRIRYK
jgi:hypothetical protein